MTAILIDSKRLLVANVGDSRAIISKAGLAQQLSVDHEPSTERGNIENRGGFVSNMPGNIGTIILVLVILHHGRMLSKWLLGELMQTY